MNIFNKVTLQSMKKSRTRTIVTVIGVVLSAAMITAVATFGVSLLFFGSLPDNGMMGRVSKVFLLNPAIKRYGLLGFFPPLSFA